MIGLMEIPSFWNEMSRPIIGLSPMDGVTDATFRRIVARHGKPDLILTEFTSVEGICHGAESELSGLIFNEVERPIAAQIYGADPEAFFHVAQLVCELGFDGLDINMGCPAKAISSRGCGAGLIQNPSLAKEIIRAARRGIDRWVSGAPLSLLDLQPQIADWLTARKESGPEDKKQGSGFADASAGRGGIGGPASSLAGRAPISNRRPLPVSVKTRLGTKQIVIKEWVQTLLEERPAAISIHGRTLAQQYSGSANWEAIAEAAETAQGSGTLIIGNGDIASLNDARRRVLESGVDGVLIGRAALGNPWIFRNKEALRAGSGAGGPGPERGNFQQEPIPLPEKLQVALEHARLFQEMRGLSRFAGMRKHLGWYCRGFQGASELRAKMVRVKSAEEAESLLTPYISTLSFV
jgi:tRNA-dihydrouridine synthase